MCFQIFLDLYDEPNQQQIKENESLEISQSSESQNNSSCMPNKMITTIELIDFVFLFMFFCFVEKQQNQDKLFGEEENEFKTLLQNTMIPLNQRLNHLL